MIRPLSTLIALTLLAGSASAAEVRVSLAGKDAQTIRAEIHRAAETVCQKAYSDEPLARNLAGYASCVDEATTKANDSLAPKG